MFFSDFCLAEYYALTKDDSSPELSKCLQIQDGSVDEAIRKIKSEFKSCRNRETLVKDTFSVLCKDPQNNPTSQIHFFSKNERSCTALIEFQKTQKVPKGFRKNNK